jgi:hypothetical protein
VGGLEDLRDAREIISEQLQEPPLPLLGGGGGKLLPGRLVGACEVDEPPDLAAVSDQ